jgi:hypothetical protein
MLLLLLRNQHPVKTKAAKIEEFCFRLNQNETMKEKPPPARFAEAPISSLIVAFAICGRFGGVELGRCFPDAGRS